MRVENVRDGQRPKTFATDIATYDGPQISVHLKCRRGYAALNSGMKRKRRNQRMSACCSCSARANALLLCSFFEWGFLWAAAPALAPERWKISIFGAWLDSPNAVSSIPAAYFGRRLAERCVRPYVPADVDSSGAMAQAKRKRTPSFN
jgi:hypothetical protein